MIQQEILLVRHTSVEFPRGYCYGDLDIDVSKNFNQEASWLKNKIEDFTPDLVLSSPLKRCTQLCSYVFKNCNTDPRLKEFNYGEWEGKTWLDIGVNENSDWIFHHPKTPTPNGESFEDLQNRVVELFKELEQIDAKKIAIFCHGGVIRALISHVLGLNLSRTKALKIFYVAQVKFQKEDNFWRLSFLDSGIE